MKTQRTIPTLILAAAAGVGVVGGLGGCRGDREDKPPRQFFPDMDDQPKWGPQSKSEFFADGRTMRQPPNGSVPFGRTAYVAGAMPMGGEASGWSHQFADERSDLLKADPLVSEGTLPDGTYTPTIPIAVDMTMLKRGQERFNIYCSACHNYTGDGKGMVGAQWSYPLPNFHDDKYKAADPKNPAQETWKDGYVFHTIRYGLPDPAKPGEYKMPPYGHALSVRDAWAVVSYFRALQQSRDGTINDVPESIRPTIQKQIGRAGGDGEGDGVHVATGGSR